MAGVLENENDSLSIREAAELCHVSRHSLVVACALSGVIVRKVASTYAIRKKDLGLLRAKLEERIVEPAPAA